MELVTLNPSNMQEAKLVENYDSLIWTERFNTVGDFQIQTGDIDRFMTILPEGTYLSLRESNVPMIVETHNIVRKKGKPTNLIIKGRAFESVLDRRIAIAAVQAGINDWNVVAKIPSDVAYYIITKICVDGILSANDIFPSTLVQFPTPADYLTSTGPNRSFSVAKGNLLARVLEFLQTEAKADATTTPATPAVVQHGIRAVRPNASGTAVAIQIYTGTDRYQNVYFDGTRDLLDDGSYLFSKVGSATTAVGLGASTAFTMEAGATVPSGMDRRVILVDGTTAGVSDETVLKEHAKTSLADAHETSIFDGSINQDLSPYVYGEDYNLGDIVRLVGDYGLEERARVTEYIRSEDATGVKSYPTLVTVVN
jgi:hypothetical protein